MCWKLVWLMAALAAPGVAALSWLALPVLADPAASPVPLKTLQIAATVQGMGLVLLAAVLGARLGPRVGLAAPAMSALVNGGSVSAALRPQLVPGLVGGAIGAAVIVAFHAFAPEPLAAALREARIPVAARLLYGGITEEVLVRWGLMTLLAWVGWRMVQGGRGGISAAIMWLAVLASALLFGVSHLPSAAAVLPGITLPALAYVTLGNALFGIVAGYLFWRHGLEAAMLAHVTAHAVAYAMHG